MNDDVHGSAGAVDQEFVDLEDQEPSGSGIGQDGDKRVRSASYLAGIFNFSQSIQWADIPYGQLR